MQLRAIMTPEVEVIDPETTLQQAAAKMRRLNIGSLPVCEGDRLIGMLTDRDITVRAVAEGCDPTTTTIREAMTPDIASCFDDQGGQDAVHVMERSQMRRLPMLTRDKRLVGMVSLGDLAVSSATPPQAGETLKQVAAPPEGRRSSPRRTPPCAGGRRGPGWGTCPLVRQQTAGEEPMIPQTRRGGRGGCAVNTMPDFGAVHENEAAFDVAVAAITRGDIACGRSILATLRDHIWSTGEQKSVQWLLPQVLETLAGLQPCPSVPTAYVREEEAVAHDRVPRMEW